MDGFALQEVQTRTASTQVLRLPTTRLTVLSFTRTSAHNYAVSGEHDGDRPMGTGGFPAAPHFRLLKSTTTKTYLFSSSRQAEQRVSPEPV